ncbi:hypothetical protein SAMN04515666_1155 [Bosea lupini]|uniref:Uncharacterized protein n=1 Tax=Bosea lupini TaxID=1036779 RepID=A0A1H7ZMV2_9HYPH|nr:hypothetical protein SAMN04515666_1155 [Bosea lupini]
MNMRVNKPDGGLVGQTTSAQSTSPLGSLLKALADAVRKVLQRLAPVLSRVNYSASMTNAAGRNPKIIWAGDLKPGQANTPQGQALIAKQERVLILLAQLLANSLANSDPAKAKENQVLVAQINAIILNDESTVAGQEAHDRGVETAAAEQKYGPGTAQKPQMMPSGGGDWIQSNGQWVHPEVARARAAQGSAEGRAVEARAKSDEATAQLAVYAADPEYRSAVAGANRTLAKTLAPEGITFEIKATKPLAQAQSDLKDSQEVAGKATQSRQKREQAETVLVDALEDKIKVRGPQGPNPQQVRAANSPESSKVSDRRSDHGDKSVRAGFAEYGQLSAEADLLDVEISELVAKQLVRTTQPNTPERAEADRMLETAGNQRKVAQANRDVAVKASDLADAERDLAGAQLEAAPVEDAALNNLRSKSPHLFEQDGFTDGKRKYSGTLQSVSVDDDPKDGQLYATFVYEHKTLVIPLTFQPGAKNVRRSDHERDIDIVWSNVAGCGPNGLLGAQQRKQAAEKAYTSSTITQIDVNIAIAGKTIPTLEKALDTALTTTRPAIPVGGPGEVAPFAGAVKSTMNGVEVWVHPEVALILSALDATRELDKDLRVQREHAVAWHDYAVFTAAQPTKLLNDDSSQHQSNMQAAYYRGRQTEATRQIELTFGAMAQQSLPDGKALFGAEHLLGGRNLKSALQSAGAGADEADRMVGKIQVVGGDQAQVTFVPFQYIDASVGSQQMLFAIVRGTDGKDHVVDGRGSDYALDGRKPENIKSFIETYQNDNDLLDSGTIVVPQNLAFTAKGDKVETEAYQAHVKTFVEKYVDPIATGVAAGAPLLMLIPGVNVVAAPLAIVAGTYVGGRQLQEFGEDIYYGREITPGRLIMETLSAGATIFPATASVSRAIGLRNAGMTTVASLRTSIGATYSRTPYCRHAGEIMQSATGGTIGFARTLDLASIAAGSPLLAVSAFNLMAHGDDPGMNPLMELMSFASGVYGTVSGLHAGIEQGRAAPQPATYRTRHVANATTFAHHAPGTAALPGGLGGLGTARGGGSHGGTIVVQTQPTSGPQAGRNGGSGPAGSAKPNKSGVDPVIGAEGSPAPLAAAAALPNVADAVAASQIANVSSTGHGDTGNGNADQQARPGRSAEEGAVNGPRQGEADDRPFMPLWQQTRQSPDGLALPADRRAEMEAAGKDIPPSGWQAAKPWKWQENAPDIRFSLLGRVRINPGPAGDAVKAALGAQVDSTPVGSPTWRSYMAGVGVRSNIRAIGAAMGQGPGAVRDALQSEAGLSIRPNEHRNVTGAQLGLPISHQTAFQFKGADLIAAGEQLIYGDPSQSAFDLMPKAGRVMPAAKGSDQPQGHVVEIVYGLSLRSEAVTLKPGETDVFGAPASNAAGFVRFQDGVPYKKVMLEDKLYLHPAWVTELPTSISKFVPRVALERRYEVAMDATFHQDFTVSREFLDLNQVVLGKLRLRTQVVVNNADDAAALAAAPSTDKLQELLAKGAVDQDQRLTYVRGSGSGLRQSAVPGLPLKETIVDLAGNKRRVWSPGSSRLEVIVNEKFEPRGLINPDRPLLAKAPTTFSHYIPSDGPIFWGLFGDTQNVALTVDRTVAWSVPALPVGVPGVRWLQLPLSASIEGRLFYRTKLPETAPAVAAERTTSWEFPQGDGLTLAVEGPRWLKRLDARAETGRVAVFPRGGNEAVGKWLSQLESVASPSQKQAVADFRRDVLPGLKDESFLTPAQVSAVHDFIAGQARPKTGRPEDGVVVLRPGALELPLKAWYETHGFTVEISRRDPMPLWDTARQNPETLRVSSEQDGESTGRPAKPATEIPDALKPYLWSVGSSHALDAASGPGDLRHLTDGTGATPEDIMARIRDRLEQEANKPEPRDLSAAAQPSGGPTHQLIAKGRGLVGQSPDKKVDGSLNRVLDYLAGARESTPGYRQAIVDLGHIVRHIENPGQGAFDARLQAALDRADSFALSRALGSGAEWPVTVSLQPAAPKPAAGQQTASVPPSASAMPVRTAGSDALLAPDAVSVIGQHGVSLMPNLSATVRSAKAFKPTPDDVLAVGQFPLPSTDPAIQTRFALTMQLPVDVYGQQVGAPGPGLRTADTQFFDTYAAAAVAVATLPPPKGSLRGGFVYKVQADAKDIAGIGTLAEIPVDWLPAAQFIYRSGDVFPAIALRPVAGASATNQPAIVTQTPAIPTAQPHVGQAGIANKASTDPIAEARQSPDITARPAYAGPDSGLRKSFVDPANAYWRKKTANGKLPEPDDQMKAQTAYLAIAQSPDDHALKGRPLHKKVTDYATRRVPHLLGSHDYTAIRYIEGPVPPQQIMGGGGPHPALNLSEFTLHSTFEGAREAVQQRPASANRKGRKQAAPGGYVYRLVGPKDKLTEAIASGVIDPKLVEGGLRIFDDGSVYPYSVANRDATYAPKPGETFVKADRPLEGKDKRRIMLTSVGYVGGAAFGAYTTARIGTGSHIGARDLLSSLAIYAWLFRGGVAGIRQGAKIRLQKRQDSAALVSNVAHDNFKPGEAVLDQLNRQVTGGRGRRLGIAKPDRERYADAIETAQQAIAKGKAPEPDTMKVVREAVVDVATQPLLGRRGYIHRVGNKSEIETAAAELHQDPTQSTPWLTIADAHLDILARRTTGWRGAVWGHSRADRMNYLLAFETLRANRLDAEAMKVLETAPGRLISPNTPTGRILEFARYASFGISNANTTRLVTNPFLDPAAYRYLGVLDTFGGAADLASNSASAAFLFGNMPGVIGTASKRGVGDADFNASKKAADELHAASTGGNVPATAAQPKSAPPTQGTGSGSAGKNKKPHPTYPATSGGGKIIGPIRRFFVGGGDPRAVYHDGRLPDGPPEADGTQKYKPMHKPSLIQRWPQYASAGDTYGMVPFFVADSIHAANAFAAGQPVLGGIELLKVAADWYVFRGAQKDYIDEYRSNRGMGPIVWHSRVTDMFNAPLNGAERNPSSIDKPWLRYGLPPLVLLGAAVAVRVGLSLVFPWEPIEEPPQPVPTPDPAPAPDPMQTPPLYGPGGPNRPIANLHGDAGEEPIDSNVPVVKSLMRFVTTEEKSGSTLAA